MKYALLLFVLPLFFACQSSDSGDANRSSSAIDLKSALPGTWEAVAFSVNIHSFHSSDSSFLMEVKAGEWEQKMQMKPILTVYQDQNKFYTQYKNLNDSILRTDRGIWNVFGDTLLMISPDATYQYQVKIKNNQAEFKAMIDWDGDGLEDDEYIGNQRLVKKPSSN